VYDAGALVAAERNDRSLWADHRVRLEAGVVPVVPAPVVAQVSRSPRQARLRRLLRGCEVLALDESTAHAVGQLLGLSGTVDIVDATVVTIAIAKQAGIVTSDRNDLLRLGNAAGTRLVIVEARGPRGGPLEGRDRLGEISPHRVERSHPGASPLAGQLTM